MPTYTLTQTKLLAHLQEAIQADDAELCRALGLTPRSLARAMDGLIEAGEIVTARIIRAGRPAGTLYRASGRVPKATPGRKAA